MKTLTLHKPDTGRAAVIAHSAAVADSFASRFLGLMFRRAFGRADALVLTPCASIHTFFMRFCIDVIFTDAAGRIVDLRESLRPWRCFMPRRGARAALEMPAGAIRTHNIKTGDMISGCFQPD
jgi:uncharacterized membrane protein (UPF0127 family)